nr:aminotransferase class V-fold PLP-dependent enzyme [uncultured Rhodopila sp.]
MQPQDLREWDLDPDFLTVNHGSFGATPLTVRQAQRAWQDRMERQPTRFFSTVLPAALRQAAVDLGRFVNAEGRDIVFTDNATTACNAVLRSLAFKPGDEVLILSHAYGAVRNAVRFVAEQAGASIAEAATPFPNPTADSLVAAVETAITPRTKLAVIDHITSGSAIVLPAARIVATCHAAGVPVLIDGAHAPGQIDLDISAIGADWYTGNCHKWLCAPKGCAFLHAPPARQAALHPGTISYGFGKGFLAEFDWTGTTDPSRFLAVSEAITFHNRIGGAAQRERNRLLAAAGADHIARRLDTGVGSTGSLAASMGTVRLPVADASPEQALAIRGRLLAAGTDAPVHAHRRAGACAEWRALAARVCLRLQSHGRLRTAGGHRRQYPAARLKIGWRKPAIRAVTHAGGCANPPKAELSAPGAARADEAWTLSTIHRHWYGRHPCGMPPRAACAPIAASPEPRNQSAAGMPASSSSPTTPAGKPACTAARETRNGPTRSFSARSVAWSGPRWSTSCPARNGPVSPPASLSACWRPAPSMPY